MLPSTPVDLDATRATLDRLAASLAPATLAVRATAQRYLVTNRGAIERKYGRQGAHAVHLALSGLARATRGAVVYLDDPMSVAPFGIEPVDCAENADQWRAGLYNLAGDATSVVLIG